MKTFNHVGLDPIELCATMVEGKRLYATPEEIGSICHYCD